MHSALLSAQLGLSAPKAPSAPQAPSGTGDAGKHLKAAHAAHKKGDHHKAKLLALKAANMLHRASQSSAPPPDADPVPASSSAAC